MNCKPVFDMPLMTREQMSLVERNLVDRSQGIEAAEHYLYNHPRSISPLIPIALIAIMIGIAALVWGRI
jgi:hypothetical protein